MTLATAWLLALSGGLARAGSYTSSAHGDPNAGVKRSAAQLSGYARGNCAHCHEQHASIGGAEPSPASGSPSPFCLFADNFNSGAQSGPYDQSDDFCFWCHADSGSLQSGTITNHDYSRTFGGYTGSTVSSILGAFNQASYHNLYDVWAFAKDNLPWFGEDSNPCCACHNPHLARRNRAHPSDPTYTAISRPTAHGELWGDGQGERMSDYPGSYQAPYYHGSTTTYEPGGTTTSDGSNLPDYVTFCTDCHNPSNAIHSTTLGRNLKAINWGSNGDRHGQGARERDSRMGEPILESPYSVEDTDNYVLACTDCHEPHGSPSYRFLIRREVNGEATAVDGNTAAAWKTLCLRCHRRDHSGKSCIECHHHGSGNF